MIFGAVKVFDDDCRRFWYSTAAGCERWLEGHPAARLAGADAGDSLHVVEKKLTFGLDRVTPVEPKHQRTTMQLQLRRF